MSNEFHDYLEKLYFDIMKQKDAACYVIQKYWFKFQEFKKYKKFLNKIIYIQ